MGVATGCGCKEVYRFPHTTYPYSSCICSFLQQYPYFLFIFKNVFRSLELEVYLFFCMCELLYTYLDREQYSWYSEAESEYGEYAKYYRNHNGQYQIIVRFVGVRLWACILREKEKRRRRNRRRYRDDIN